MSAPDVVYRLGVSRAEWLRYSLRSLVNIPHGDVHVIGHRPSWLVNVHTLEPSGQTRRLHQAIANLHAAARQLAGKRFLLVDDDMYFLKPRQTVEHWHRGPLRDHARTRRDAYGTSLARTAEYLERLGIESLSYELHIPMLIDADSCAAALELVLHEPLQGRSVYGNVAQVGGDRRPDVKVKHGPLPSDFLSTSAASWRYWQPQLHALFPEPGAYE